MTPDAFFASEAGAEFEWRVTDCAATADKWIYSKTGKSPISISEQEYADEKDAKELLSRLALPIRVARAMRRTGFKKTNEPRAGDLAVIRLVDRYACAIRGGNFWLFRDEGGISGAGDNVRIVAAWRIE